jgi:hypothetical protein
MEGHITFVGVALANFVERGRYCTSPRPKETSWASPNDNVAAM